MFKVKRARSVVHSAAHHGVSALSWLHPRLGEECKAQNLSEVSYDLHASRITTKGFSASKETQMAFSALQSTFERIAATEKIHPVELSAVFITFGFNRGYWPNYFLCSLTSKNGKVAKIKVDGFGKKYGLLSKFQNYS